MLLIELRCEVVCDGVTVVEYIEMSELEGKVELLAVSQTCFQGCSHSVKQTLSSRTGMCNVGKVAIENSWYYCRGLKWLASMKARSQTRE